jgi:hypothetical protein
MTLPEMPPGFFGPGRGLDYRFIYGFSSINDLVFLFLL